MNLKTFENFIESTILEPGRVCYEDGHVETLASENNEWTVKVFGEKRKSYKVTIKFSKDNEVQSTKCDCSSISKIYCEHQVAAFFAIRSAVATGNIEKFNSKLDLHTLLNQLEKERLVEFLEDYATQDKKLEAELYLQFSKGIDINHAREMIRNAIESAATGHRGLVEYHKTKQALGGANKVLTMVEERFKNNLVLNNIQLCLLVLVEMEQFTDICDNNVEIMCVIIQAVDLLRHLIQNLSSNHPDFDRIFEALFYCAETNRSSWGYELPLLDMCIPFCDNSEYQKKVEKQISRIISFRPDICNIYDDVDIQKMLRKVKEFSKSNTNNLQKLELI